MDKDMPKEDLVKRNPERPEAARRSPAKTPASDMQAEDAGTAASGNDEAPTEPAMKQTSKTGATADKG